MDGLKINFGCGSNRLDGWLNHDAEVDITKPLPYGDDVADEILAEHVCEHVSTPDFFRFLLECKRILKRGGILWLSLPVLDHLNDDHAKDIILNHGHLAAYTADSLRQLVHAAEFSMYIDIPNQPEIFGHWKVIGAEKDDLESCRLTIKK